MTVLPKLKQKIADKIVLWFEKSNKYIIADPTIENLIETYTSSKDYETFKRKAQEFLNIEASKLAGIYDDLTLQFKNLNQELVLEQIEGIAFDTKHRKISCLYEIGDIALRVFYSNIQTKQLLHPQLEHLCVKDKNTNATHTFDVQLWKGYFYLFDNQVFEKAFREKDFPLLQGKFNMKILCALHQNTEQDWIASLHASTIAAGSKSVLLIGKSGQGKSTLSAHLMTSGYQLIADDITPLKLEDKKIYPYPAGISIKKGAFDSLKNKIKYFGELPLVFKNHDKGHIKYIPPNLNPSMLKNGYDACGVVLVNFKENSETKLENINFEEALHVLIPDSWIASDEQHATKFLDWIATLKFYKLTYSKTKEALDTFSSILELTTTE